MTCFGICGEGRMGAVVACHEAQTYVLSTGRQKMERRLAL